MKQKKLSTKKMIIITISLIVLITLIATTSANQNFWETLETGNILFINTGNAHEESAITGWYPVENWEVETCTRGQTSDFKIESENEEGTNPKNNLIVDLTISLQGTQQNIQPGYKEYEVAWYIQPFGNETDYELQYKTNNHWKSFEPAISRTAGPQNGDKGYYAWSGDYNISAIRIKLDDDYVQAPMVTN